MQIRLTNRVAVVTGGSKGIGLATARRLLDAGASVMITSRRTENLETATAHLHASTTRLATMPAHAGDPDAPKRIIEQTVEHFGTIDILVNNAATNPHFGPLMELDRARAQKTLDVNLLGVLAWCQAARAAGLGSSQPGAIVNVASIGGLKPEPGIGWYDVTKAAVIHLTELSVELAPTVRVNAVAPGVVKTDMAKGLWQTNEKILEANIPAGRLGEPDDIAAAIVYLCSDDASWVTGQVLVIDGGTTMQPSGGVVPADTLAP